MDSIQIQREVPTGKIQGITLKTDVYIIPGNLDRVLLGLPFLIYEDARIEFKEASLRIGDRTIFLDNAIAEYIESPDAEIMQRAMCTRPQRSDEAEESCARLIEEYQKQNPTLGAVSNYEMEIKITDDSPIHRKPFTVPHKLRTALENEIYRLKELKIIRESSSRYACPAFVIVKKNGDMRLVVDYRPINRRTISDSYPFPNMHEEIRSIPKSEWFSQIDLSMGYHQIEMAELSKQFTSFVTPYGQFEYNQVPFGLKNAPRIFQRMIRSIFSDLPFVRTFLDDILIFSQSKEEHLDHVKNP